MPLHVSFQAALLAERLATQRAVEAIVLVVDSEVGHHVALLRVAFATDGTGIRLFFFVWTLCSCVFRFPPCVKPLDQCWQL